MQVERSKPPTKWQRKREASYLALVDSAMRRFAERGYGATRIEDIVEPTGYTSGAFYFHFKNKLDCFWAVIDHRERLRGDWVPVVTADIGPDTPLEAVLTRMFAHFARADPGVRPWAAVMAGFHQQHRDDPDVHPRLEQVYAHWRATIARFVAALRQAGVVHGSTDVDVVATQAFAYVDGLASHALVYRLDPEATRAALIDGLARLLDDRWDGGPRSELVPAPPPDAG